jgi:CheY-like chemotaxis protein
MTNIDPKVRINLAKARILLLDDHVHGGAILGQILLGLGARRVVRCGSLAEAQAKVAHDDFQLFIVNANLRTSTGYDFVDWLRHADLQPNSFAPVILVTGHTPRSSIEKARDCGANTVVAKPVSPQALLDRILWAAGEKRPFVHCGSYLGPDRRFHKQRPAGSKIGRRHHDPSEEEELDFTGT